MKTTTAYRKPSRIAYAYIDFDSFFASVEQQRRPELRGRPVAITPSSEQMGGAITVSREAKAAGCPRVASRRDLLALCPDMAFVAQDPEHYMRVHHAALEAIDTVVPVHIVRSIDEMGVRLTSNEAADPHGLAARIREALADAIGPWITASIGFSTNRVLAKMAGASEKPEGCTVWHPDDWPGPLLDLPFAAVPGIGERMVVRLADNDIFNMEELLAISPKHARRIWGNVVGERMWHYLHGYEMDEPETETGMIGHGRVLPRAWRGFDQPYETARLLTIRAARRMRRWGYCASRFYLALKFRPAGNSRSVFSKDLSADEEFTRWASETDMPGVDDDHACLAALDRLWTRVRRIPPGQRDGGMWDGINVAHVQITFMGLEPVASRQSDMFADVRPEAQKWRAVTKAVDSLNTRYKASLVTQGPWVPPPGGNAGGKIAFCRVPEPEDFMDAPKRRPARST